jgi:hypothetical protein
LIYYFIQSLTILFIIIPLQLSGLDQNKSRCVSKITGVLVKMRKHVDVYQLDDKLKDCAPDTNDEKMYVLSNDDLGGQEIFARQVLTKWCTAAQVKKSENRNASVATRAMAAFCLQKHRAGMSHFLSGKWFRGDYDQCTPTSKAFAEAVLQDFKDPNLVVYRASYMDNDDHDPEHKIDPHNCEYAGRDAVWLLQTWTKYVKPKLKKALVKWYKETGGGSRDPENFVNYCSGDKWIAGIYAMDVQSDFILSSEANGRPPSFVRLEAGFEGDAAAADDPSFETPQQDAKARKAELESTLKDGSKNLSTLLTVMTDSMKKRKGLSHLDAIHKINERKRELEDDDDFDDELKEQMLASMKRMKQSYAKQMIEEAHDD